MRQGDFHIIINSYTTVLTVGSGKRILKPYGTCSFREIYHAIDKQLKSTRNETINDRHLAVSIISVKACG